MIQSSGIILHAITALLKFICKNRQAFHCTLADLIHYLNGIGIHSTIQTHPLFFPAFPSADAHRYNIFLQKIDFFSAQICQSAAKMAKDTLIRKILYHYIQRRANILHKRIHQHRMFSVKEIWNLRMFKHLLGISSISFQISGDHRNVSITIPFLPNQAGNPSGHFRHLAKRVCGGKHLNFLCLFAVYMLSIAKQMLFQMKKSRTL